MKPERLRIGVYVGAFDPVHAGHLGFALQATEVADLDEVIFLPERHPRGNPAPEHYAHRIAMLKQAVRPHPRLAVMEVPESRFLTRRTLPHIRSLYPRAQLVLLTGADDIGAVLAWPHVKTMFRHMELLVGTGEVPDEAAVHERLLLAAAHPKQLFVMPLYAPDISSTTVRQAIRSGGYTRGLLESVRHYAAREWLYVSAAYHQARPRR